ncbi:MAG: hypothetical protein QM647_10360 [Asticcacaulis sp.]|uniref:hypothetical protein n=1 Tax=Asticcacaulis sp. TaxID=1872648 RepID=UPI0039E6B625
MFRKLAGMGLALALGVGLMVPQANAETPFQPLAPEAQVAQMGRGVNIIGYDPYWQAGGKGNYTEAHGFAFAYWQFSGDFILYDFKKQQWVEPILNALIPPNKH